MNNSPQQNDSPQATDAPQTASPVATETSAPKLDVASLYPTPVKTEYGGGDERTEQAIKGPSLSQIDSDPRDKRLALVVRIIGVAIIAVQAAGILLTFLPILLSDTVSQNVLGAMLLSRLLNFSTLMAVLVIIVGIGIMRLIDSARKTYVIIASFGVLISVPFTVSAFMMYSENASKHGIEVGPYSPVVLLSLALILVNLAVYAATIVFLTRKRVKRLFH